MIDINILRKNPDLFRKIISSGRGDPKKADIDQWLDLDKKRSALTFEKDEINKKRNELAKLGSTGDIEKIRLEGKQLKEKSQELEKELEDITAKWQKILDWMPNIPLEPMPEGKGDGDNIVEKLWTPQKGYIREAVGKKSRKETDKYMPEIKDFKPKHHVELGEELGVLDVEQSAKTSGSRFSYIIGDLATLQFALQQFLFNYLLKKNYKIFIPPLLVRERVLYGTSHFPEGMDQVYAIDNKNIEENTQLYLLGSTEPSNFAYFMDKIIDRNDLPIRLFAYAPAFRSEVGSWGKDVRGIKRVHQFDKIEINAVTNQDESQKIFYEFLSINEWFLQSLKIPYQVVRKCTGDAGYLAASVQMDVEAWLPGQKEFIEVMTDTNTTDYQARRLNIRYKDADGKLKYAHTVNDTGCAMGRILISIMENYQQKDGSILIPSILKKYTGLKKILKNK